MSRSTPGRQHRQKRQGAAAPVSLGETLANKPAPDQHQGDGPWAQLRSPIHHPLIYRRMVASVGPTARAGDIVAVYDRRGDFLGHGLFHDRSQIAIRILSRTPDSIDEDFWRNTLERAILWRRHLMGEEADTNTYRLVHAEGDGLSGLIVERYDDWIAIEVFSLGIFQRIDLIKQLLTELTGVTQFVVRADERIERLEGFSVAPGLSDPARGTVTVRENGLRFRVDLRQGHKTGFFCDQRDNRFMLARLCQGQEVLDACCYTGGFGIYAARRGGASGVTGVDLDEDAIAMARKNSHLNEVRINHVHADAFAYIRQMKTNAKTYDVVVLDPPKLVSTRDDIELGKRKYIDLNTLGMSVTRPGGLLLTCSCSGLISWDDFAGIVKSAAIRVGRSLQIVNQTGAAPDHPVMSNCPESSYLKAIWARVL